MENQHENIAETVLRVSSKPFEIAGQVALPYGWKLEDAESVLDAPRRKKASVSLSDEASFVAYLKTQGSLSDCTIWCDANYQKGEVSFTAILNDHGTGTHDQQWRDHIAKLSPAKSVEWQRWNAADKKSMSQLEFASFIEGNLGDIASADGYPTGTAMLQMATNMEIAQDSTIKSAIRLQSGGVRMEYVEDSNAETVKSMEVFSKFALGLPVFWGGAAYQVDARLKYRLNAGKLSFWYELNRPDKVLEDAAKTLTETIQKATGFPLFHGNPFVK